MKPMKKFVTALSLCAALMMVSCTQMDVNAAADSDGNLATEAELSPCCEKAVKVGKDECCMDLTGLEVCEESGKVYKKSCAK